MASRTTVTVRLDPEDIRAYQEVAAAIQEGLRLMGVPQAEVAPGSLMRDVLAGGANRWRSLMGQYSSPVELVKALGDMSPVEVGV